MKRLLATAAVVAVCASTQAFAQFGNGRISGNVADATGAVIPGVEVTATHDDTGVANTVLSNSAGAYNFASLLPGAYTVEATLPGFQTFRATGVELLNQGNVRLNVELQVGQVETAIEVSVEGDTLLLESSSTVGDVLEEEEVTALPLVENNVLDLVRVMSGVTLSTNPIFGAEETTFAGVSARDVNVQRDGISVNNQRWPNGVMDSGPRLHPDLVGEVKLILAPVDAEMGRGNGQFVVSTRAGTNEYHGALEYAVQNSWLDANTWGSNRSGSTPPWRNIPQAVASIGGPIVRNQTHFFVLYDQGWARTRSDKNILTLTPCARNGIFRYFDNWNNGNARQQTVMGRTPTIAVVNEDGSPRPPATNPDGTPHNGILRYASVFGPLPAGATSSSADCSDLAAMVDTANPWDPLRSTFDRSGIVQNVFLAEMPEPNAYNTPGGPGGDAGDGLNFASHRWLRTLHGQDNRFGIGEDTDVKQINVRIDHQFNPNHKFNGSWSFEQTRAWNGGPTWPNSVEPVNWSQPQVLTTVFTSTLAANMVNEARFGMSRNGSNGYMPFDHPEKGEALKEKFPVVNGLTIEPTLGCTAPGFFVAGSVGCGGSINSLFYSSPIGSRGGTFRHITVRDNSPRYTFADTVSLTTGNHAHKLGGVFRVASSKSMNSGSNPTSSLYPNAKGGEMNAFRVTGINSTNMPGLAGTENSGNRGRMEDMLVYLAGSLSEVNLYRFLANPEDAGVRWNDPSVDSIEIRDVRQYEFAFFYKDDWKVLDNLTLNLGIRWDYYGVPFETSGLTGSFAGGPGAIFGISGRDINGWAQPGARADVTQIEFVGPNSPNPNRAIYNRDLNNFGPALGFAWNATDATVVRGGYQIQYIGGGNMSGVSSTIARQPGTFYNAFTGGDNGTRYLDLTNLAEVIPPDPPILPARVLPIGDRSLSITAYDENRVNPYVQNLTLSITHQVANNFSVDLRYIGTMTRNNFSSLQLNSPNFLTNGLKEAFDAARSGGESALLDDMLEGVNVAGFGWGPVGSSPRDTGAAHMRASRTFRTNLANGNYSGVANSLARLDYFNFFPGNRGLPPNDPNVVGEVLRLNGYPDNFIITNPQYNGATLSTNAGYSNYHSFQIQGTLRPTYGLNLQNTYTWSRNLGVPLSGYTDPFNQAADYSLLASHRLHSFQSYGTFRLPIGPNQLIAGNASGLLARLIEDWEASFIVNLESGRPMTVGAQNTLYGNGVPDLVGDFDTSTMGNHWEGGADFGNIFPVAYSKVRDPQCGMIAASLQGFCTLNAIADPSGNIILQNARPGTRGSLGRNTLYGLGYWGVDMAISKGFQISETWRGELRIDANNIFNHPTPGPGSGNNRGTASVNLAGGTPFGQLGGKGAATSQFPESRQFQFKIRLEF